MSEKTVRVANGQGFWGDSPLGPVRLVREGPLDYLTMDYLAEVTMSILQKLKSRDPSKGYATDFVKTLERILPEVVEKNIKVIANAGGVNPRACQEAVLETIRKAGYQGVKVGIVSGDNILDRLEELIASGEPLKNMDDGRPLSEVLHRVLSANVYVGAEPLVEALGQGAQIIIAGRCTDPALVAAPLIHEFGWSFDDHDRLAAGTVAGHILECGAQCTGGNFTDWRKVPDMARIGYPIVEGRADGSFDVTKHPGTGGLVTIESVSSQLVYEMGDPKNYITPDVVADFSSIQLEQVGDERVRVSGVQGRPRTETLKVSISYSQGYKAVGQLVVAGPDAEAKARLCADIIWKRLSLDGVEFPASDRLVELVGSGVCFDGIAPAPENLSEVALRIGVRSPNRADVDRFGMELAPLVTSGPPGVTGFAGGRPKATEIVSYWPALVSREKVETQVVIEES